MLEDLPLPKARHDPDATRCGPWGMDVTLDPGLSLVAPPTGAPSDAIAAYNDKGLPLTGDNFTLSGFTTAQTNAAANTWSCSFYTSGSNVAMYRVAWHYYRSDGTDDHVAMRIQSVRKRTL